MSASLIAQTGVPSFANNLAVAGPNRPPQVPEGYVITPFGYFHPSCVLHIAEGETLLADGRIEHVDGTADANVPVCNYPRFSPTGAIVSDTAEPRGTDVPAVNGWLESVWTTTTTSFAKVTSSWPVPPLPTINNGETLFFFPGLEDISAVQSILQPVLQWYAPGPWAVASWNCCLSGITVESTPVNVSPGDTILGTISSTCKAGAHYCAKWNVISEDKTTGKKTTLSKTPSDGQIWNWAFGGVMEVYGVTKCTDYPKGNKSTVFTTHLYDQNLKAVSSPSWTTAPAGSSTTPKCGYGLHVTATQETLDY
ncbi:MAG: hypothetical protein WCC04_09280 [Terriglobales bacterium]